MRSASQEGGVVHRIQVLHVHVFLVAPLGAGNVAQPGTDQHQRAVSVREHSHGVGSPADLTIQTFNPVVAPGCVEGECLLRTTLMASHTEAILDEAVEIISRVLQQGVPADLYDGIETRLKL